MTSERAQVLAAQAYPPIWRLVAAALVVVSRASLPVVLGLVLWADDPPVTPPVLLRLMVVFALLPALAGQLIRRAMAAEVQVKDGELAVRRRDVEITVPVPEIARIAPWRLPLPGAGATLWTRSGTRLRYGIALADPTPLLQELGSHATQPIVVYARSRGTAGAWRWWHLAAKFPLFALLPTAVLFNAHQHIAYGGPLGEYHLLGLAAYLRTLVVYWLTTTIYCVLWASVWRALAESVCLTAATLVPTHAIPVRRAAERFCAVAYFGGVPLLLALRFLG